MSYVFIVTSAINSFTSFMPMEQRYDKTFETIKSIRDKVPGAIIILAESSPYPVPGKYLDALSSRVDHLILNYMWGELADLGKQGLKSPAECYSMYLSIAFVEQLKLSNIRRVFKLTGRGRLTDDFDISYYNDPALQGKFVYKKRVQSWMSNDMYLVDTRISSFCYSILPEAKEMMKELITYCMQSGRDVEHCTFEIIDKDKLIEKDVLGYECQISSNGEMRYD